MSCQQLLQEDPYVFTDSLSNSTSFMHETNSQTKYVPLSRQTIYNRQFRQHEPTIALSIDINGRKSSPKIIINPSSLKHEKKNGSAATRTSPKSFKTHQIIAAEDDDDKSKIKEEIFSISNHSIASQTVSRKENHVAGGENGIIGTTTTTTGIKQEISEEEEEEGEITGKSRDRKIRKIKKNHHRRVRTSSASKNVIIETISETPSRNVSELDVKLGRHYLQNLQISTLECFGRDERLKMKKFYLQHLLSHHEGLHQDRKKSLDRSKRDFANARKLLKEMNREKEEMFKRSIKNCLMRDCGDEAIALSDYCIKHILSGEKEQYLIRQCCFLHNDGQQCRVPIYDIMATIAVCSDHLNASPNQLITINGSSISNFNANSINNYDPMKPKKPQMQRKRNNTNNNNNNKTNCNQLTRPVKKCSGKPGRKKKMPALPIKFNSCSNSNMTIPAHRPTMIIHPNDIHKKTIKTLGTTISGSMPPLKMESSIETNHPSFIHQNSGNLLASSQSSYGSMSGNEDLYLKQDLMTAVCENSYESSEDTGVGGLSENELMSNDVIGNFDMESCAELSKVLSSLPSNTLDDLLTEPLHTSRDDEEYLDRAIEEVSASGMDQIAITAFEHLEGLDMLEMLDDEEQRQMISAATNLISMSGYLSHDQDNNYSAMPSPMMS